MALPVRHNITLASMSSTIGKIIVNHSEERKAAANISEISI